MAPNRKNVTTLPSRNHDLQSTIQPKFLPLTHPKEQQQQCESYWVWPASVEEQKIDVLSADNITSNLIQAAAALSESRSQQVAAHDDYWADQSQPAEVVVVTNKPQQVECSYWDWPAEQDSKKATIDLILAEEEAYRLVSGSATEKTEVSASPVSPSRQVQSHKESNDQYWAWESNQVAAHSMDASHPNANYWDWNTTNTAVEQQNTIQALLEYEAVRQMLMTENIVRQLQAFKVNHNHCVGTQKSSEDYWCWSEHYGDQYWDAPRQPAISTGNKGYWEW
jgi:hypothetical protein